MTAIAIMQPYFFPYIGYWQLINAVDRFILYNEVNYIARGWVNRNRILVHGAPSYITVPLAHASSRQYISAIKLVPGAYWRNKLIRTIAITYGKAPCFDEVFPLIGSLIRYDTDNLSEYLAYQIKGLAGLMGINTEIVASDCGDENLLLTGQERIIDLCRRERASCYLNLPGGQGLYNGQGFADAGLALHFIAMRPVSYPQRAPAFIPGLSIIDALMALGAAGIKPLLDAYDLR